MRIDQQVPQAEVLAHAHECVVHSGVAVGVVAGDHITDHGGAFHMAPVVAVPVRGHRPEDPAMHRLEAVAHVRQSARHDDRHGVVQEGLLHLGLDLDVLDAGARAVLRDVADGGGFGTHATQMSRKRTSAALAWMNDLRPSTSSPISREKTASATAASSIPTRSKVR